jgi:hypothetical protein
MSGKKIKYTKANTSLLHLYGTKIKREGQTELYVPANVGGNHWIAGNIDFNTKVIGFGMIYNSFGNIRYANIFP